MNNNDVDLIIDLVLVTAFAYLFSLWPVAEIPPYNKEEWQRLAQKFLTDKSIPASALDSAHIALRIDDPELAQMCKDAAPDRRKKWGKG